MWEAFRPNGTVSSSAIKILVFGWVLTGFLSWLVMPSVLVPGPFAVIKAMGDLWAEGLGVEIMTSFMVNAEALLLTVIISLVLSYLTVVPALRPVAEFVSKGRFLGIAGLSFLFTISIGGGRALKVAILVFGMTVFFVTSMMREVAAIPKERFDHARTLRMGEWQVVWEVIVLGKADTAIEVLRQNAAMGWMMLPMVEGLVRSEGGIGSVLLSQSKHFHLAGVFAIQIAILLVGLGQDLVIGLIRQIVCPYADLTLERR